MITAEKIIERLTPKIKYEDRFKSSVMLSRGVFIGDVLLKTKWHITEMQIVKLNDLWIDEFGNVSLQQIFKDEICTYRPLGGKTGKIKKQLSHKARNLFDFINSIL